MRLNCIGRPEPTTPSEVAEAFDDLVDEVNRMVAERGTMTYVELAESLMNRFERLAILGQRIGDRAAPADQQRIVRAIDRFNENVEAIARGMGLDVGVPGEQPSRRDR
jgi:hypothetical protein